MKINKVILAATALMTSFCFDGCKPKEANIEPVADTEVESAVDAAWATYVICDIDQICGFVGENLTGPSFYSNMETGGYFKVVRDTSAKQLATGWNQTLCMDGRKRDGSIFMYYKKDPISNPSANENSRYYRDFGFVARVAPSNYKVDGWLIELYDGAANAYIYNKISTDKYDPRNERLSWSIEGKFKMTHPTDPSKNIVWDGKVLKTLTNSTDKDIFAVSKQSAINWVRTDLKPQKGAICTYSGKITGMTSAKVPFTMTIDPLTPLKRDYLCSSDPVSNVTTVGSGTATTIVANKEEHHPFIAGIASFTTGMPEQKLYPRQIYFGNEGLPDQPEQCDNTGVVMIKGISYKVNFRK